MFPVSYHVATVGTRSIFDVRIMYVITKAGQPLVRSLLPLLNVNTYMILILLTKTIGMFFLFWDLLLPLLLKL